MVCVGMHTRTRAVLLLAAIALAVTAACREPTDPGRTDELLPEGMVQFDAVIVDVLAHASGAEVLVDSTGRTGDPDDYAGRLALLVRVFTVLTRADGSVGTIADLAPGTWIRATTGTGEFRSIPPKRHAARVEVLDAPPEG